MTIRFIYISLLVAMSIPMFAKDRPNILLFITDDQSWDSLGFMGGKVHTPRIDQMAKDGMYLSNFNVTSTVCSPSRYSFLTGRYAGRCEGPLFLKEHPPGDQTQVENIGELEDHRWNLPKVLQYNGYYTGFVGKSHVVRHDWLTTRGARTSHDLEIYPRDADLKDPSIKLKMQRNHAKWCNAMKKQGFDFADGVYGANLKELEHDELNVHNLDWTISKALKFLDSTNESPFFLTVSTTLHHGPAPWVNRFSLDADPRMTGEGFIEEGFNALPSRDDVKRRNRAEGFRDRDAYALWLDDGVGALLDKVKALGKEPNTIVIFVPDHGSYRHGKATLYDYGMRVPMLVQWSGTIKPGSSYDGLIANIDLAPTLLDLCNIKPPTNYHIDGISFKSALFGGKNPLRKFILGELGHSRAVKTKDWKYIAIRYPKKLREKIDEGGRFESFKGDSIPLPYLTRNRHLGYYASQKNPHYFEPDQLYDLENDPEENMNLFEERPEISQQLQKQLGDLLKQFENRPFGEFTVPDVL